MSEPFPSSDLSQSLSSELVVLRVLRLPTADREYVLYWAGMVLELEWREQCHDAAAHCSPSKRITPHY